MYVITDGKNYVIKNPMQPSKYMLSTSSAMAMKFEYKQAKSLLQNPRGTIRHIKNDGYYMVEIETGKVDKKSVYYKGNGGVFIGNNDIDFDENMIIDIFKETKTILGLAGWDMQQLETYRNKLNVELSKCDSGESDIVHALQKYKKDNEGKKPQAHKVAKLGYLLDEVRDKHEKIKQCLSYIKVMQDAITYKYDIEKLKLELSKAQYVEYQGRTEYWKLALEILS